MSQTAVILPEAKAQFKIGERPIPKPGGSEILVKNVALATNPVDWKIQSYGMFIQAYPTVLGSDISGVVEAVGPDVKLFKEGDRVAGFATAISNSKADHGAFQQYSLLNENATAKIPDSISFEEGSLLPMAVATSGVGIFLNLGIPRPTGQKQSGGFLVWGASSSVGSAAVQIARSLGFTVYAVASPHHHSKVREWGASHVFDYNDANVVKNIVDAANKSNQTIQYAFDSIAERGSSEQVVSVVEQLGGGGKVAATLPFPENAKKPENIEVSSTGAFRINTDSIEFGAWLFNEWLQKSLTDKTFVPSPDIQIVDGGLESIPKALELHKKGVSGKKLVIPLA